jgi:hypothetical protein
MLLGTTTRPAEICVRRQDSQGGKMTQGHQKEGSAQAVVLRCAAVVCAGREVRRPAPDGQQWALPIA